MLMSLIPLFDENMAVSAYSIFSRKNNFFTNLSRLGAEFADGASGADGLNLINSMGIDTLSADKPVFVPLTNISILTGVEHQTDAPANRIVFLIDGSIPPIDMYLKRIHELKDLGYGFAVQKLSISDFIPYAEILKCADYIFLDYQKIVIEKAKIFFEKLYPSISLVAVNIDTMDTFLSLKEKGGYKYFEGPFYRVPVTRGDAEVTPLKINYIQLLNTVNGNDFNLDDAAKIIGRDTALTISLLQMVNKMTVNSGITTIRHASAMLGQKELRKWINTAVANALYADKPSEITRVSLLRAKFAEFLASEFGLAARTEELFLMGLFSVLDVIMEKPMSEALGMLQVGGDVKNALIDGKGPFAEIYEIIRQYEAANWTEVSRILLLDNKDTEPISQAYIKALEWYRDLNAEIEDKHA